MPFRSQEQEETYLTYQKIACARSKLVSDASFWKPEFDRFRECLSHGLVLDAGCGNGRDSSLFLDHGYSYLGIDFSENQIENAKQGNPFANFACMDMYHLPLPQNSVAGLWVVTSLFHFPKQDIPHVLGELGRVQRTHGIGFFVMLQGDGQVMESRTSAGDRALMSYVQGQEFADTLACAGFEVLEHTPRVSTRANGSSATWLRFYTRNRVK
jgi:SAM-dependent methyltransferase